MKRNFAQILPLLAILGLLLPSMVAATEFEGMGSLPDPLVMGFEAMAQAFEADSNADSVWDFPFGAPESSKLTPKEFQTILALRRTAQGGLASELSSLVDQAERLQGTQPAQMHFWLAFAHSRLDQKAASLRNLRTLLETNGSWQDLDDGQRAWVLTGTPDLIFLDGDRDLAANLYRRLAASPKEQLTIWANYQLAGMDFLERSFAEAGRRYSIVCEAEHSQSWRDHACAMAAISVQLQQLRKDGEPNGHHDHVTP